MNAIEKYARHVNPGLIKLLGVLGFGRVFVRALGTRLWDDAGREYRDFLAGFGSVNLGHNHPRLVRRMQRFLEEEVPNLVHTGPQVHAADLAEMLAARLPEPLRISLFSNSGAEAVEAGVKLARAATRRPGVLSCDGGFHGTNLGTLSLLGEKKWRAPFEPLLPGCARVAFGDLKGLEKALAPRTAAAFVVEPIQGEGGVVVPAEGYLTVAQDLCRRHGTLLVLDEVQTGLGRTGTLFAYESEGFVPDVLVLAKALGGSIAPIGATITSAEIQERAYGASDRFDLHGSTFSGNSFACAAAMETLAILSEEKLVENSAARGLELAAALHRKLDGHPLVREIRGRGLLVGIEFGATDSGVLNRLAPALVDLVSRKVFGQWVALKLLEKGILSQPASQQWNVLRLEPPLTVTAAEVEEAAGAVAAVVDDYRGIGTVLKDVAERLGRQYAAGWSFR